jgi:hypothetical protein
VLVAPSGTQHARIIPHSIREIEDRSTLHNGSGLQKLGDGYY